MGGVILGIFIAGEFLFCGSLAFLGMELVLLLRDKIKGWFGSRGSKYAEVDRQGGTEMSMMVELSHWVVGSDKVVTF